MPTRKHASRLWPFLALGVCTAAMGAACSAKPGGNTTQVTTGTGGAGGSNPSGTGAGAPSGTGGDPNLFGGGFPTSSGTGSVDPDAGCAGEATKAQLLPLDMFIMLDQSGSMDDTVSGGGTKWTAVTGALQAFVTQPGLNGISVGIQYFGLPPSAPCPTVCNSDADCGAYGPCDSFFGCLGCFGGGDSCDANDYSSAEVEIAPLPGVASAIISSMNQHSPLTSTPTSAALQGGVNHSKTWAQGHAGHVVVHVFATDGDPTECDTNLPDIDAIAAAGANGTPKVLTFVIGVGSSLTALNGIAAAGGTGQAFIVDTTQNVNQQFLAALNTIRGAALGCQYKIPVPDAGMPDYGKVNVQYTPGGSSAAVTLPQYQDKAHCPATGDGWYYDNDNNPTQILLCDSTCSKVSKDSTGEVDVVLGCATKMAN